MLTAQCETETNFNSVERLLHYATELEQEAPVESTPDRKPAPEWPSKGGIRFDDVQLRYRPDLPPVLSHFSLEVHAGESLGVCGRTGARTAVRARADVRRRRQVDDPHQPHPSR